MTEEQLFTLLDSYAKHVANSGDRQLFTEAVAAAKSSALRAAYFTLWICCLESLKHRFEGISKRDSDVDKLLDRFSPLEANQGSTMTALIAQARQRSLISDLGAVKLSRLYSMQQVCSDVSEASPTLETFVADAFAVVNAVLCRSAMLEWSSAMEHVLVLQRDMASVVETLSREITAIKGVQSESCRGSLLAGG